MMSSLYKHLVRHGHAARNPVGEVERPAINRDEGHAPALFLLLAVVVERPEQRPVGLDRDYSAHSMRATFVTTALEKARSWRTSRRPPGTATRARPNSMIGEATIRRGRHHFLRHTRLHRNTSCHSLLPTN
jgi:hypothetical protein